MLGFLIAVISIVLVSAVAFRYRVENAIGFLHPNSGGGGGGERVLWVGIRALQTRMPGQRLVLFTRDYGGSTQSEQKRVLLQRIEDQFSITIETTLEIVFLNDLCVRRLDPTNYPRLTLLRQTFWSGIYMFIELCFNNRPPALLIETVGIPFVYPLVRGLSGVKVLPYVHYPIISTDMVRRVRVGESTFNNSQVVSSSAFRTALKLYYYQAFSWVYWFCGLFTCSPMANSSWTANHIEYMWGSRPVTVYPPCNVEALMEKGRVSVRKPFILSVGQFRPEKNHSLQLRAFARALPSLGPDVRLIMAGGARGAQDEARVKGLKEEAIALGIRDRVDILVSRPYSEISQLLSEATVGLHTMTDEHFGIVVVEYQAAGALVLAHNSAGPKMDIVRGPDAGSLAVSEEEFASAMVRLFDFSEDQKMRMRSRAWEDVGRFTDDGFGEMFAKHIAKLQL